MNTSKDVTNISHSSNFGSEFNTDEHVIDSVSTEPDPYKPVSEKGKDHQDEYNRHDFLITELIHYKPVSQKRHHVQDDFFTTESNLVQSISAKVQDHQNKLTKVQKEDDVMNFSDSDNESSADDDYYNVDSDGLSRRAVSDEGRLDGDEDDFIYEVLSTEQVVRYMIDIINDVSRVLRIPPTATRMLLNYFNWNKEMLCERFYDCDQDRLFKDVDIVNPTEISDEESKVPKKFCRSGGTGKEECRICFREVFSHAMTGLAPCGHRFCTDCWQEYLATKILDEEMGQTIPCAAHACDIFVDDETVMNFIADPKVKLRYQRLITSWFVECNRFLRWCPQPDCNNAVKVQYVVANAKVVKQVKCDCDHIFCFGCGENWHEPVQCHLLKTWKKKCADSDLSLMWITANTKECPRCHSAIENDREVNVVACPNPMNCSCTFCWICLKPLNRCDNSSPNSEGCESHCEEDGRVSRDTRESSRFLFYYNLYTSHMKSFELENMLHISIKENREMMQSRRMIDMELVENAFDILCHCRRTLMYTYVFAYYYLRESHQSSIFRNNQQMLDDTIEKLTFRLQGFIECNNILRVPDRLTVILAECHYCKSLCTVLLDHLREGYEKGWWEYRE